MKVIHIITSLGDGGAENTLYKICKHDSVNEHIIISLKRADKYSLLLKKVGIKVYHLNMKFYSILNFFYLIKLLHFLKPDIVQTWLIHGDLIGGIASKLSGIKNIIWNVRYSNLKFEKANLINILLIRILVIFSFIIPRAIIVVSKSAKKNCENLGYCKNKLMLINNGYELSIFKNNLNKRITFRKKLNISNKIVVLGNVARYAKMKDHLTLLKALSLIQSHKINFLCVLIGSEINKNNLTLVKQIKKLNLSNNVKLLGKYDDISQVMNGIDIYIQSSKYGEGFPNVVAESMACGTPCVVTDVGDAAFIVGKTGWIVPPNNSVKLAKALEEAINQFGTKNWIKKSKMARLRVEKKFDISKMISFYNTIWLRVFKKK